MKKTAQQPVHQIRIGAIKASIWSNQTESGVRYNTTFVRLYKEGERWKSAESFGRDDLLVLGKVADRSHSWICDHVQANDEKSKATQSGSTPNGHKSEPTHE